MADLARCVARSAVILARLVASTLIARGFVPWGVTVQIGSIRCDSAPAQRSAAQSRGQRPRLPWLLGSLLSILSDVAWPQSQIQYIYDAAGNVVQITRSSAPSKPDLIVPNLSVAAISINANGSYNIPITFQVKNIGSAAARATWKDFAYLSQNAVLNDNDLSLGVNTQSADLAAGASYTVNITGLTSTTTLPGTYTLFVKADGGIATSGQYGASGANSVDEADETNNVRTISITLPAPDLTVTNLAVGTIILNADNSYSIPVTFQVNNVGTLPAKATWTDFGYLSTDGVLHDTDPVLQGYVSHTMDVAVGANYQVSTIFRTSTTTKTGRYTLVVKADGGLNGTGQFSPTGANRIIERSETNNTQSAPIVLPGPDLTVNNLTVGAAAPNQDGSYNIPVTFQVNNVGGLVAKKNWYDFGYLSADGVLQDTDQVLGGSNYHYTDLVPGASYAVATTLTTNATTPAGNYKLIVKADGGQWTTLPFTPTGPNYVVEVDETNNTQVVPIVLALPDLTVSNLVVGTVSVRAGGGFNIPVTFQINNVGGSAGKASWTDYGYLAQATTLSDTDQVLGGSSLRSTDLAAGASYTVSTTLTTSATTTPGNHFIVVKADGGTATSGQFAPTGANKVMEANDANNTSVTNVFLPGPDLLVSNLTAGTSITVAQSGAYSFPVSYTVTNNGGAAAQPSWYDAGYLSTEGVLDNADQALAGYHTQSAALAVGASYTINGTFTTAATTAPGTYTLFVKADGKGGALGGTNTDAGRVVELDETNNARAVSLTLPTKPDLTVSNLSVGSPITVSQAGAYSFPVTYTVTNSGGTAAAPNWYDVGYLSTDGVLDNADVALTGYHQQTAALAAGASYTINGTLTTTATTTSGAYTLFVKADGRWPGVGGTNTDNGVVAEANETNNTQALSFLLPTKSNLTVSNASIGAITVNQNGSYSFPVTWTVTNSGGSTALPNWYDAGYLSSDGTLDNTDLVVGYQQHTVALAAGTNYTASGTYTTATTTAPGTYTLFVKADGKGGAMGGTNTDNGNVGEANETNNTQALSITLPTKPDLTVSIVSVGTIVKNANNSYSIPVTYAVTNNGVAAAQPSWYDVCYLSTDGVLDNTDQVLAGYHTQSVALAAGGNYTVTGTFTTTTTTVAGPYTLFVKADGRGGSLGGTNIDNGKAVEGSETNNTASATVVLP